MVKLQVYTSDRTPPRTFLEQLQAMPGQLDCRWNAAARRFDILELDRRGRWDLVMTVPAGRDPDGREIHKLGRAFVEREHSLNEWFDKHIAKPNEQADLSAHRAADALAESVVQDNIDFIMDTPRIGYDRKAAEGVKELSNGHRST